LDGFRCGMFVSPEPRAGDYSSWRAEDSNPQRGVSPPAPKRPGASTSSATPAVYRPPRQARATAARGRRRLYVLPRHGRGGTHSREIQLVRPQSRQGRVEGHAGQSRALLLLVSAALVLIVTIGGWSKLARKCSRSGLAYVLIYVIMAYYVVRWESGRSCPMAAALAIILGIFAAIAGPEWFDRDQDRLHRSVAAGRSARPAHAADRAGADPVDRILDGAGSSRRGNVEGRGCRSARDVPPGPAPGSHGVAAPASP